MQHQPQPVGEDRSPLSPQAELACTSSQWLAQQVQGAGYRCVLQAIETGNAPFLEAALQCSSKSSRLIQDASGRLPLHRAVQRGCPDLVAVLLQHYPSEQLQAAIPANGRTALHLAVQTAHSSNEADGNSMAAIILSHRGMDCDLLDDHGAAPIHYAAAWGLPQIVSKLLQAGADANRRVEATQETALHIAALASKAKPLDNRYAAVAFLLLAQPSTAPQAEDAKGLAPLHHAACSGSQAVSKVLLCGPQPVDPNKQTRLGRDTALHIVARMARPGPMEPHYVLVATSLLQQPSIQPAVQNASGCTPMHLAACNGSSRMLCMLSQHSHNAIEQVTERPCHQAAEHRDQEAGRQCSKRGTPAALKAAADKLTSLAKKTTTCLLLEGANQMPDVAP